VIQRHLEDAPIAAAQERPCGFLDPLALNEFEEGFSGDRVEHPVEVKGRERGDMSQRGERQFLGQMLADVVDDAVDALLVLDPVPSAADPRGRARSDKRSARWFDAAAIVQLPSW
jgi:hypothetical protein